jgi:hypothetical protein
MGSGQNSSKQENMFSTPCRKLKSGSITKYDLARVTQAHTITIYSVLSFFIATQVLPKQ